MFDSPSILGTLIELGLNEREAKVYLALLQKKSAIAAELQRVSGIPQNKIYDTLNSLLVKGYLTEKRNNRSRTFEIVNPKSTLGAAFDDLKKRHENAIENKLMIEKLYSDHEPIIEPNEYIEILYGEENTHSRYIQLIKNSNKEILGFSRPPYTCNTSEKVEEQLQENMSFLKRNGVIRWIYELNTPDQEWILPELAKGQKGGMKFRVTGNLPLKMAIFDKREMLIIKKLDFNASDEMINIVIKNSDIASAFFLLFEFFWNHSTELDDWRKSNTKQ